jgi:hypothetical protein
MRPRGTVRCLVVGGCHWSRKRRPDAPVRREWNLSHDHATNAANRFAARLTHETARACTDGINRLLLRGSAGRRTFVPRGETFAAR